MKNNNEMLGKMDIRKLLIKLSVPAAIGFIVNALYNFVDTLFVSNGVGVYAIGGLTIAFPIQMIVMALAMMVGMGSASVFSRAFGRGDKAEMDEAVNTGIRFTIMGSLIVSVLGFLFLDELLVFFGATELNVGYATEYMSVILFGLIPLSLSMVLNNLTRAEGRAKVAMVSMMVGTGLNIVLDPIFIYEWGLNLGVQGAAIATVISQFAAFFFILRSSISKKSALNINFKRIFNIHFPTLGKIVTIGMPSFLRNAIGAFLAIIIMNLINRYADSDPALYISIYGVINRVITIIFMPGFGIIQGLTPIVGFNFGAKNHQRTKEAILVATKWVMIYFIIGFILVQLFATQIFMIFSETNMPLFVTTGANAFRIISIGFIVVGFQIVASAVYQAVGFPIRAMIVALSRQVLFFIPLAYLLTFLLGIQGVWIAFAMADGLAGLISAILLYTEIQAIQKRSLDTSASLPSVEELEVGFEPAV
ncbi:MAG: MATE family efflux transporter [bacterium]|nr:MATE family efflux transporter [bacterium]